MVADTAGAVRGAAAALRRERASLEALSRDIEGDFVRLGAIVGDASAACARLRATADDLHGMTCGEGDDQALVFAYQLFKKYVDLIEAGLERTCGVRGELDAVAADVGRLGRREREIADVVTELWLLKTSFRVEATTLAEEHRPVLIGLTDGIDAIQQGLKRLVEVQFGRLADTRARVTALEAGLADADARSRRRVGEARRQIVADLDAFAGALAPAAQLSREVAAESGRAGAQVDRVIVSLQFHDIVRQRVEHVAAASDGVAAALESADHDTAPGRRALAAAHRAARLQLAQLRDARAQLDAAGGDLLAGVGAVLDAGDALLAGARSLQALVTTGLERSSASATLVARVRDLHVSKNAATQDIGALTVVAGDVERIVADLSVEVVTRTEALRLVAMNAGVHASRVPGARGLQQLAAITRASADAARGQSRDLLGRAQEILGRVHALRAGLEEFVALSERDRRALDDESTAAGAAVEGMRARLAGALGGVDGEFVGLRDGARRELAAMGFRARVTARFGAVEAALVGAVAATAEAAEGADGGEAEGDLDRLRGRYTMERERELHDAAAGRARGADEAASAGWGADGLGDNVEPF